MTLVHEEVGLSAQSVCQAWRHMKCSRLVDDRLWLLSRQGKVHFVITAAGHEAAQVACALAIHVGQDYIVPYYRDMTLCLALGMSPLDLFLHAMGKTTDPSSGGRQMYGHFSRADLRIVSGSSSVGSHPVHAVGLALACRITGETERVAITFFGEGATAEGAWHEALNFAGIHQLPVVFVCESNNYAISVPHEKQVPVPHVADKAAGYGLLGAVADGNDLFASYVAAKQALENARQGKPTLLELKTQRLRPHSNADNDLKYRSEAEIEEGWAKDPILRLERYLVEHGLMSQDELKAQTDALQAQVDAAIEQASATPPPPPEMLYQHLYATEG
jgi:2-oxoisovalerate dehydrogenase E1 component alpha subunit